MGAAQCYPAASMPVRDERESQLQRLLSSNRQRARQVAHQVVEHGRRSLSHASDRLSEAFTAGVAALTPSLMDPELLRWSGGLTHSATTVYERALDVEQVRAHLGGLRKGIPELLSASLGAAGLVFVLQRGDVEQLSELLGSMGITALLSANPLLGLCVVATTGYAYRQAKKEGEALSVDRLAAVRGAALAGSSAAVFSVMAGPVALKLVVAIAVTGAVRKLTAPSISFVARALTSARRVTPAPAPFSNDRELVEAMRL